MKNSTKNGFDQHYNAQVVVEHDSRLIVGNLLLAQTTDKQAALTTVDSVPPEIGTQESANLDNGYFSEDNVKGLEAQGIDPYIATSRSPHHQGWRGFFTEESSPPAEDASAKEKWPTNSVPTLATPSIVCENPRLNPS